MTHDVMQMQPLTGTADIGIIGRGGGRQCVIQFAPLKRPRQHFHQHLRHGLMAVDRYRRWAVIAFAPLVVRVGI